jgi:hypothetical protein
MSTIKTLTLSNNSSFFYTTVENQNLKYFDSTFRMEHCLLVYLRMFGSLPDFIKNRSYILPTKIYFLTVYLKN